MNRTLYSHCPNRKCPNHEKKKDAPRRWYRKRGQFEVGWSGKLVQRYQCKTCKKTFSTHTFKDDYKQQKPYINEIIQVMLTEGCTISGVCRALHVSNNTVLHRLRYLGKKYGPRADNREQAVRRMLRDIKQVARTKTKQFLITSDRWSEYRGWVNEELPFADYKTFSGKDLHTQEKAMAQVDSSEPTVFSDLPDGGSYWLKKQKNGKLIKKAFDPLFRINQKCAVLRSRLSRLRKRFWGFTQKIENLEHHLWLFIAVNNGYDLRE
jgi:transposase-like protein